MRDFLRIIVFVITSVVFLSSSYGDCRKGRLPEVGEWVTYSILSHKTRMELKLSIVGEEMLEKDRGLWFEMIVRTGDLDFIIKRLITGDPLKPAKVYRQIVKIVNKRMGDYSPAIETPIGDTGGVESSLKNFPCLNKMGEKGTYKHRGKIYNANIIKTEKPVKNLIVFSEEIPFFGIIKIESEDSIIELLDYGKGATTQITEEPFRLDTPNPDGGQR
jgi:hypothetical protein